MRPGCAWQKHDEEHTGRKNNCVQRKWESHSTKEVFLCCLAAGSQIKAAVNWSNICIFLPFLLCAFAIVCVFSCTHIDTCIRTQSNTRVHSRLWEAMWGGRGLCRQLFSAGLTAHAPSRVAKGMGPQCKGHALVAVVTSFSGGTFPPVCGY